LGPLAAPDKDTHQDPSFRKPNPCLLLDKSLNEPFSLWSKEELRAGTFLAFSKNIFAYVCVMLSKQQIVDVVVRAPGADMSVAVFGDVEAGFTGVIQRKAMC
jgi:hypothetical protein